MVKSTLFFDGRVGHVSGGETTNPTIFRILRAPDPKSGSAIAGRNDGPRNIRNMKSESKIDPFHLSPYLTQKVSVSRQELYT